ncbi:hypothetical protein SVAN01_00988 [Stagonosporopsis vannaccii]|nr:hypothetical protein SVAN01_00988 [Stagonosporopsis vannaccii]
MKTSTILSNLMLAVLVLGRVIYPQVPSLELSKHKINSALSDSTLLHSISALPKAGSDLRDILSFEKSGAGQSKFTEHERDTIWDNAVCKGEKLRRAMMLDEDDARKLLTWPHVQSEWDGDLKEELKKWGYSESDKVAGGFIDNECNFAVAHTLSTAFKDLGIDTRPAGMGGPNHCYQFKHRDGPTVLRRPDGTLPPVGEQFYEADGKRYRITDAFSKNGINAKNGLIAFIHRTSPKYAAKETWNRESIADADLPKLRATSDLAWGMWHRETTEENRKNIKCFLSTSIINEQTQIIVSRALNLENPEDGSGTPRWPGKDFEFHNPDDVSGEMTEAAYALLGSNNGMAAGYFLVQHRRQLGPKSVWKMRVFTSDSSSMGTPNILFYVDNGEHNSPITDLNQKTGTKNRDEVSQNVPRKARLRRRAKMSRSGEL